MSLAYAEEAIHVHDTGHLSDRDIARATGAAPSTVREWLARRSAPSGVRAERLAELSSLVERLARVIHPTYIPVWLRKPMPALDDDKPIDRIAKGDYRAVARLISGLETQAQADVPLKVAVTTVARTVGQAHLPRITATTRTRPITGHPAASTPAVTQSLRPPCGHEDREQQRNEANKHPSKPNIYGDSAFSLRVVTGVEPATFHRGDRI
jgi:hypothetical protein